MNFENRGSEITKINEISEQLKKPDLTLGELEAKIKEMGSIIRSLKRDKWRFEEGMQKLENLSNNSSIPYDVRKKIGEESTKIKFERINEELLGTREPSKILNILKKTEKAARESQISSNKELKSEIEKTRRLIKPFLNHSEKLIKDKAVEIDKIISKL